MMPVAWIKNYQIPMGKEGRVFDTTMGPKQIWLLRVREEY
tara:strand:- start:2223 stop:2342 length:120 start_codon:yes stop_codon:yes gene_type:complete